MIINTPCSGKIIPLKYLSKDRIVIGMMIEINRGVYMNDVSGGKGSNFEEIKKALWDLLEAIKGC